MISLDSNKIKFDVDFLMDFDASKFVTDSKEKEGDVFSVKHKVISDVPGLNYIEIDETKNNVIVTTSAKILSDNYFQGININTIEQVIDKINKTGLIKANAADIINNGEFLNIDVTDNIKASESPVKCLDAFNSYRVNNKYKFNRDDTKHNQGIVYQGKQKSFKERMILYSKFQELKQYKNRSFLDSLNNPMEMLRESEKVLRIESNSVQLRKIRERLNIQHTGILDVLESPVNLNYNLLNKIVNGAEQLKIFEDFEEYTKFTDIEKRIGMMGIIEKCNFDMEIIHAFIKSKVEGNIYRYVRRYRNLMFEMLEGKRIKKDVVTNGLVNEVLELLKVA